MVWKDHITADEWAAIQARMAAGTPRPFYRRRSVLEWWATAPWWLVTAVDITVLTVLLLFLVRARWLATQVEVLIFPLGVLVLQLLDPFIGVGPLAHGIAARTALILLDAYSVWTVSLIILAWWGLPWKLLWPARITFAVSVLGWTLGAADRILNHMYPLGEGGPFQTNSAALLAAWLLIAVILSLGSLEYRRGPLADHDGS
ncbi:MAG TPA: hypothetical protein VEI97_07480 [bacterium]|nr:hypothetical protein [bacterium]